MKKNMQKIAILFILFIIYTYVVAIQAIPSNLVVFQGENIHLKTIVGLKVNSFQEGESIEVSNNGTQSIQEIGKTSLKVSLFDHLLVKKVDVDVLPKTKVIPVGSIAGLKLYTSGVLVVGMSEIEGADNKKYKPYENSGIKEGDTILAINDKQITSTEELIQTVNQSDGKNLAIEYRREEQTLECSITPARTSQTEYKLGLWVRDSAAGVGTVTFYEPETKTFGALGHGITDIDTEQLIHIASGEFVTTKILNIAKGEVGTPGKIQGTVENQKNIGSIMKNTKFGIYGKVDNLNTLNIDRSKEMEVALREEIKLGKAKIMCSLENGKVEEYEIEIQKIFSDNNYDNKSMQIKVTDVRLLEKTGGIIQGMSGSPVIQNGKFIGAITHVLVNNPQEGYAVFGDIMLKQAKQVE